MATTSDIQSIIDYIKQFLLYGNAEATQCVGYTANEDYGRYRNNVPRIGGASSVCCPESGSRCAPQEREANC